MVVNYIKKHWRPILEILGLLGLVFAFLQLMLQQQQFDYEQRIFEYQQAQKTELEYSQRLTFSANDNEVIMKAAQELTEKFYELLYQYREANGDIAYLVALEEILPLTSTISPRPVSIEVLIENKSVGTATDVRMILDMDRPITSVSIDSLEPYEVITGGVGNDSVTVEVDRIVTNQSVKIAVDSEQTRDTSQVDQLVIQKDVNGETGILTSVTYDEEKRVTSTTAMPSGTNLFPQIRYIPAEQPEISITVTSNEGPAKFLGQQEFGSSHRR